MSTIRILDKLVAERIAAGEVVERPASVVKELVENSIDAGASAISIEVREGGTTLIRVGDNGSGMSREDARLAVERFATSKIVSEKDLAVVRTLGFRGEALPSIAGMSQLEILTRVKDQVEGTRVQVADGKTQVEVAGAPVGTQVIVRHLFYNAPARRKFLKAPLRETELIQKTVILYALAYPQIGFRLVADGREVLVAPAAGALERIGAIWGREVAGEMLEINYTSLDLSVRGFISGPTLLRASREWQIFFVNGRPIRSGLLAVMLERPYLGRIPPNRHPLALIKIDLDPQQVDVNVHPRKAEVRLYQERSIYGAVAQAVEGALRGFPLTQTADATAWPFANVPVAEGAPPIAREASPDYSTLGGWRAVAQVHNTYILVQAAEGMAIVDQHAAHEQILYELLTTAAGGAEKKVGLAVELSGREAELLNEHLEEYAALGVDVEPFGENTFRLNAIPALVPLEPREFLTILLQEHERNRTLEGDGLRDRLAAKAACVSAVKAGDPLTAERQQALLQELAQAYAPAACPHGRPVFVMLRLEELERRFLRR